MPRDNFLQRKKDVLSKLDKSSKGNWDENIKKLCEKINSLENYYTTSSCSGRIIIMIDQDKKADGLFIKSYHNKISFQLLKKDLNEISKNNKKLIKFKQEPCIIHIVCKDLEYAKIIYDKAKLIGWKKSGLIYWDKSIILEINSTEKLEFPIIKGKNILVNDAFLKILAKKSNKNLERGWERINRLSEIISNFQIDAI